MTADRRATAGETAGKITASRQQSIRKLVMTADRRAALVEKVARKLAADTCGKESEWPLYMRRATAAIDLIRAETLEEAAKVAETCEWWMHELKDSDERGPIAAAIRALKGST